MYSQPITLAIKIVTTLVTPAIQRALTGATRALGTQMLHMTIVIASKVATIHALITTGTQTSARLHLKPIVRTNTGQHMASLPTVKHNSCLAVSASKKAIHAEINVTMLAAEMIWFVTIPAFLNAKPRLVSKAATTLAMRQMELINMYVRVQRAPADTKNHCAFRNVRPHALVLKSANVICSAIQITYLGAWIVDHIGLLNNVVPIVTTIVTNGNAMMGAGVINVKI